MADTLGSLRSEVLDWLDETNLSITRANAAINDAIESLWQTLMRANLSLFMGGPVSLSIGADVQGVILVSVADPVTAPTLSDVVSGALAQHAVTAGYTLVTESGTETMLSSTAARTVPVNNVCSVASPSFAAGAIGWHCYAGTGATRLCRQNDVPISFGVAFQEPDAGFQDLPEFPGVPAENTSGDDICYIRHLEAQMPDLGWKSYQAGDIDSLLMTKMARGVSIASEYQTYYYDLINQRQLEFRPATGMAWAPRYFYVKRPRRLRYDNATLPFLTVPSTRFLRCFALSDLSLSIREFDSADGWQKKAEEERLRIELSVIQQNHGRNQFITPFM